MLDAVALYRLPLSAHKLRCNHDLGLTSTPQLKMRRKRYFNAPASYVTDLLTNPGNRPSRCLGNRSLDLFSYVTYQHLITVPVYVARNLGATYQICTLCIGLHIRLHSVCT
jgi:hypothetical protein